MKLGFNQATCMKNSTLEQDLMYCEKYGYDYIEIRLDMLKDYLKRNTLKDLQTFFKSSHLQPYALNSIENINFCTPNQWEELLELFYFACEIAKAINNPYIIVVPTMGDEMYLKSKEEVFKDSVLVLNTLAEIARPYGVKIAFEPIGDKRWCVRSLQQAMDIIEAVDRPDVGVALDAFNLYLYHQLQDINFIDAVPLDKIFVYHINDSEDLPLNVLDHCNRLYPGDGIIPLKELSKKLQDKGYDEICSVELFRPEYWKKNPEEVIYTAAQKTMPYL